MPFFLVTYKTLSGKTQSKSLKTASAGLARSKVQQHTGGVMMVVDTKEIDEATHLQYRKPPCRRKTASPTH